MTNRDVSFSTEQRERRNSEHWVFANKYGNQSSHLLDKLKKKALLGDKFQKEIVLPTYVKNVSKVIIWCAWAEGGRRP